MELSKVDVPTMYFIGVTTGSSSSARIFPKWAETLGLGECRLVGIDLKIHDRPDNYREVVDFIKSDPLSLGALVTTHKMDLFTACEDDFDMLDPLAKELGEVSSIYKREGKLCARATDPTCGGMALEKFLPEDYFRIFGAEVLVLGAGGSSLALVWHFLKGNRTDNCPSKIHIANRSQGRLDNLMQLAEEWGSEGRVIPYLAPEPLTADQVMNRLNPCSMVVNATGLGKDGPGSPLTDQASFPERGLIWEFNYRGELKFLQQAMKQKEDKCLSIEDGWDYFVIGWSQVIGDVFDIKVPIVGSLFNELSEQAIKLR